MTRILICYYSSYGHVEKMARSAVEGVKDAQGEPVLKRVAELTPLDVARKAGFKLEQEAPLADPQELADYDGVLFGTPTRYGNMAAQMRNFLDQTGKLWASGVLVGRAAGAFCSTATQHGGQETTLTSFHSTLLHLGYVVVGLPYSAVGQMRIDAVTGGSPYGATTIAGSKGERQPSDNELDLVRFQARHLTEIAGRLKGR